MHTLNLEVTWQGHSSAGAAGVMPPHACCRALELNMDCMPTPEGWSLLWPPCGGSKRKTSLSAVTSFPVYTPFLDKAKNRFSPESQQSAIFSCVAEYYCFHLLWYFTAQKHQTSCRTFVPGLDSWRCTTLLDVIYFLMFSAAALYLCLQVPPACLWINNQITAI